MNETNDNKKSHHYWIILVVLLVVLFACVFGIAKFVNYRQSQNVVDGNGTVQGNTDGNKKLFSRSVNNGDIIVDSELDLSNFGSKFVVMPQTDIKDLKLTINFLDGNGNQLTSKDKFLGNVKQGVSVSFSISLLDLGVSVGWNTEYTTIAVTGGTVSYFA